MTSGDSGGVNQAAIKVNADASMKPYSSGFGNLLQLTNGRNHIAALT
jgi:hypothetical protein